MKVCYVLSIITESKQSFTYRIRLSLRVSVMNQVCRRVTCQGYGQGYSHRYRYGYVYANTNAIVTFQGPDL